MKIIDVNILVYAVDRQSKFHAPVLAWWNNALNGNEILGLPWIAVSGFIRIGTNSRLFDNALTVAEATQRIDVWLSQPNIQLVQETTEHWTLFREFVQIPGAGGNRTTDAHLAAIAVSRGASLVSTDRGFARFSHLRWENPVD